MPKRWIVCGIWAFLISAELFAFGRSAGAEQPTKPGKVFVSDVIISGNQRVDAEKIKTRLRTQAGKEYNPLVVDDDVRELYKTNQFSNISTGLQSDGLGKAKIYFSVCEKPNMVQKVTFLGAKHIKEEELRELTGVKPGRPLNRCLNCEGCFKIQFKYEDMGRPFALCQLLKGGEWSDTEVVYQITEGPKVKICDIRFTGNAFVTSMRLSQKIPLRVGGAYTRETAQAGINELYSFYRDSGYRDVRISPEIKHDSVPGEITMIYHIHEGPRYRNAGDSQK